MPQDIRHQTSDTRPKLIVWCLVSIACFLSLALDSFVLAAPKTNPEKTMQQAKVKEEAGDYEGAAALYEKILKEAPDDERALMGLAQVAYWAGNYQKAIDTYAKVLTFEPDHVQALVGTGKAYLALGKQRKAQEFFNKAERRNPENEEVEAVKPQLEKKTKMTIEGGYITENPTYASQTQGEYQEIKIAKEKAYSFGLNTTYLRKFNNKDAFDTKLFGSYYIMEDTRLDFALSFAPKTAIVPRQSYEAGLAQTFWKITPEVHYLFEDYKQANLHTVRPALYFEPLEFLRVGGGYEFQNLRFGVMNRNFHGGFGKARITPLEWISFGGFYSRVHRGFEGGRTPTPFVEYKAHIAGGGIQVRFQENFSVGFNAHFEKRNNGENNESYTTTLGYIF